MDDATAALFCDLDRPVGRAGIDEYDLDAAPVRKLLSAACRQRLSEPPLLVEGAKNNADGMRGHLITLTSFKDLV